MLCPRNLNKINHNTYNKVNPKLQNEYELLKTLGIFVNIGQYH